MNILIPFCLGSNHWELLTRIYMLRTDYRQYPTYLTWENYSYCTWIYCGCTRNISGSIDYGGGFYGDYFFNVAASQFREVRNMERNTLAELDNYEMVPRGKTYIEGIAIAFESRNYL